MADKQNNIEKKLYVRATPKKNNIKQILNGDVDKLLELQKKTIDNLKKIIEEINKLPV